MSKNVYVGIECVFNGIEKYRKEVLESMRAAYDKGDNLDEQKFLNGLNWYKTYTEKCRLNRDSIKTLKAYRDFFAAARYLCIGEREAIIRMLRDCSYPKDLYSISVKARNHELLDASKPELHYGDILTNGLTIVGNSLVSKEFNELYSFNARGGQAFFFDPVCDECDYCPGDYETGFYTVNKISELPKILGLDKK